jgi:hypothetical protein
MVDETIEANVIEDGLMISGSSFEIDMSEIQRDIEDLTVAIDGARTVYGEMLVEADVIGNMVYGDVRRCEREMSSRIRAADELRRKLNRDYKVPLDRAKVRYDELMEPVIELHAAYRQRRIELDDAVKASKKRAIQALYENMMPYIALPLEGQDEALVPFDRIFEMHGAKWLNKSVDLMHIESEIESIAKDIVAGERQLDEEGLVHAAAAKAVYWQTLSVDDAIAHDRELCVLEERQAALSAERAQRVQFAAAPADDPTPKPTFEPIAERKPRVMLIDGATDDECRRIGQFCRSLGISGVFKGPQVYDAVKRM